MAGAPLYDAVLESLPEDAHHRRAWLALLRCFGRIERELMQFIAQKYDSSLPRYDVLTALAMSRNGLTMGELATVLKVSKGNITGVVRRLKSDRLVKKITSRQDRRVQSVSITPQGLRLWEEMHEDYDRIITELLSGQSVRQLQTLFKTLERTIKSINKVAG
jgi:DNA-binding MarR family transcriptional regulator